MSLTFKSRVAGVRLARLRASAPRHLLLGALCLLLALGLRSLFVATPATPAPRVPGAADAPSRDFALQFARAYLTYDAARPGARARALAPFLSQAVDRDAGFFAARGRQEVLWAQIASDQTALAGGRAITVAAGVDTQSLPIYLTVTVLHERNGSVALVGYPAIVGAPSVSRDLSPPTRESVEDRAVNAVVGRVLRNYLGGSARNLRADLAPDAAVTLPTTPLKVRSIERTEWLGGVGSAAILAALTAVDSRGATYSLAYELGIERRERPYVDFIEVIPTAG